MKRAWVRSIWFGCLFLTAGCWVKEPDRHLEPPHEPPHLIVQITLDQFRGEIVPRMDEMFTGGFRRLLDEGFYFEQGRVDHGLTASHPGHASLATGAYPASHGLVANEIWVFDEGRWRWVGMVDDRQEHILGFPERVGPSPRSLSVPTLGTWLKWERPQSRSITISNSSFAAVAQAGWASDGAYWLDGSSGRMVTSSYYLDGYPAWVEHFNDGPLAALKAVESWDLTVPEGFRQLARPDAAEYEASGGDSAVFPHRLDLSRVEDLENPATEDEIRSAFLRETPFADQAILLFAIEAVRAEQLGQRGTTDYLNIGIGSPDNVGHTYGPRSLEQLDVFFHLDRDLGAFFAQLDATVGAGRWVVAVSGDHGAPDALEYRLEQGLEARRVDREEINALLDDIETIAAAHTGSETELVGMIEARLESAEYVAEALTQDELMGRVETDFPQIEAMRNSYRPGLTPEFPIWGSGQRDHHPGRYGIWVVFREYATFDFATSVHGSPYLYDQWVPILFYGSGVKPGRSPKTARIIDIAPTLADLAAVPIPASVDGEVLREVVQPSS